jgi:hypothetical protein
VRTAYFDEPELPPVLPPVLPPPTEPAPPVVAPPALPAPLELPLPVEGALPPALELLELCLSRQVCFSAPVRLVQSLDEPLAPLVELAPVLEPPDEPPVLELPPELPPMLEPPLEAAPEPEAPVLLPPAAPPLCAHATLATPSSAAVTAALRVFMFTMDLLWKLGRNCGALAASAVPCPPDAHRPRGASGHPA